MRGGLLTATLALATAALAQGVTLEGYVYEDNNSGYLNEVSVRVLDAETGAAYGEDVTDRDGHFAVDVPRDRDLLVRADKRVFEPAEVAASSRVDGERAYVKVPLARQPGYTLEVTLAEARDGAREPDEYDEVDAIQNSLIEVYNNTRDSSILVLRDHPSPYFSYRLEQGNHYTLLIRSPGYFTKRIESYVNVDGCILCMDGVSEIGPGVSDNLSAGNDVGTLLANVELTPMRIDSAITLNNIYYAFASAEITPQAAAELDKVADMLAVNPAVVVELGSHTDSRGTDERNYRLSQRRAQAVVDYLVEAGIDSTRMAAKGYGESQLTNVCALDIECTEEEHAANRRTELRITGFTNDPFAGRPLTDILADERAEALLAELLAGDAYRAPAESPDLTAEATDALDALRGDLSERPEVVDPNSPEAIAGADPAQAAARAARIAALRDGSGVDTPASLNPTALPTPRRPGVSAAQAAEALRDSLRDGPPAPRGTPSVIPDQTEARATPVRVADGEKLSGWRVLVFASGLSLGDENGQLFFKYGTLDEAKLSDGSFGYLSGAFKTGADAQEYMREVSTQFPEARVLRYVNGFIIDNAR